MKTSRLTKDELKLKEEISNIIKKLNEKICLAEKSGIKISLSRNAENDGTEDSYQSVSFTMMLRL